MNDISLPALIEPDRLESVMDDENILILDLSKADNYAVAHVPGAVNLDYSLLVSGQPPAPGRFPSTDSLARTLAALGWTPARPVVAYDDEGGGKAGRFLWTMHVLGFGHVSVMNGGMHAWGQEGHPVSAKTAVPSPVAATDLPQPGEALARREDVLVRLGNPRVEFLDARTPEEFAGVTVRALRGGHIPGAVNLNWLDTIDRGRNARLKPDIELRNMLEQRGLTPEKEIIVYCQTHHRSSHSYLMLKHLGYRSVRGYAGAWSEWGNDPSLPVET